MKDPYIDCACTCGVCDVGSSKVREELQGHCEDHCKPVPLDARDKKLLDKLSEKVFEFSHNTTEEKRLSSLFRRGMVDRRSELEIYRPDSIKYRWAYRRRDV